MRFHFNFSAQQNVCKSISYASSLVFYVSVRNMYYFKTMLNPMLHLNKEAFNDFFLSMIGFLHKKLTITHTFWKF